MLSANCKPKRTAAASRGFLATARLCCCYCCLVMLCLRKLKMLACSLRKMQTEEPFRHTQSCAKLKSTLLYRVRQIKVIPCRVLLISQQRIWIFIRKFTRLFISTYNCQIMLYYHNIWLSCGTWTETTPRFVTCKFDACVIIDCSKNCVPAQKHWLHSDVNYSGRRTCK